jgi:hypothetical protein
MTANWPVLALNSKGADVTVLQYLTYEKLICIIED